MMECQFGGSVIFIEEKNSRGYFCLRKRKQVSIRKNEDGVTEVICSFALQKLCSCQEQSKIESFF